MSYYDLIFALIVVFMATKFTLETIVMERFVNAFSAFCVYLSVIVLVTAFDQQLHQTIIVGTILACIYVARKYYVRGII